MAINVDRYGVEGTAELLVEFIETTKIIK